MSVGFLVWLVSESRESRRLFDAAEAERVTAKALRRLYRRGWRSVDHVEFDRFDIDHVVAGPGGVFAVETKWTNYDWQVNEGAFADRYALDAVAQSRDGAARIAWLLRGNYKIQCDVSPLLVIWGPGRPSIDAAVTVNGVLVLPGELLRRTLAGRQGVLDIETAASVIEAVDEFTRRRDQYDVKRQGAIARPAM